MSTNGPVVPDSSPSFRLRVPGVLLILTLVMPSVADAAEVTWASRVERYERFTELASMVDGGVVDPRWLADGRRFCYGKRSGEGHTFVVVDTESGSRAPFFDETRLRARLGEVSGISLPAEGLPFSAFSLEDGRMARFMAGGRELRLDLDTYELSDAPPAASPTAGESVSPDGRWVVSVEQHDLWVRDARSGERSRLTHDGEERRPWTVDEAVWSADGRRIALPRYDARAIHGMPVVKWLPDQETVDWVPYPFARELDVRTTLHVADLEKGSVMEIERDAETGEHQFVAGWREGDSELLFLRFGPGMRTLRLMAADPSTGATRTIVRDEQETFIEGLHFSVSRDTFFHPLPDNRHFVWKSERDGWLHFYLYRYDGALVRRLTRGEFEVASIVGFDEKSRELYFTGQADPVNPYDVHLYRVSLKGRGMKQLTASGDTHAVTLCPDFRCFVDNHSSPARPPTAELRRIDGSLLTVLERADVSRLEATGWKPPEEFVVKAADGVTDLHGLLFVPHDFDPEKRYPVIEVIYAGSWAPIVPRRFARGENATLAHALAQLNFVTFIVDGRGTPGRGKAFQDVIYGQIGRHEIPDHVATLRQLAADRPWMDLGRVGVHGKSWGGYFALRAMLQAPDVYHVGVASGIIADLSTTAAFPVAPYMGLVGENEEGYAFANCLTMADRLEGRLLLTIATADVNTPFAQTMRMVEAFIKARKPVDLMLFPDQHHWLEGESMTYFYDVLRDYFVEHLRPEGSAPAPDAAP